MRRLIRQNWFLPALAALVLLGGGGFYASTEHSSSPSGEAKEHTVELTADGFRPQELTIRQGDTVTFRSSLGRHFWPASDLHPTHTIYPEFDPKEPIEPAKVWSFRFQKVGTWKYHDHLSPYFTGVITVVGAEEARRSCEGSADSAECWQDTLLATLEQDGLEAAFDEIARLYRDIPEFVESCHYLTHNVGLASYKLYLKDKDSVLTPKAAFCANGFYHGFMESFLTAVRDPQKAREFCVYVDEKLAAAAPDAALQCYHGIGHGAMDLALADKTKSGDEERIIAPALALCEEASKTDHELYRCASGVFNGIANFYITGEHGLAVRAEDPLWLCHKQPERYKESCYGNMNSMLFWFTDKDFPKAAALVERMPDSAYATSTMRYLAALATIYLKDAPEDAIAACRALPGALYPACIEGFAHGHLEHGTPDAEYEDAILFCRSAVMTKIERDQCFRYVVSNIYGWYPKEKVLSICAALEDPYKDMCRSGNAT